MPSSLTTASWREARYGLEPARLLADPELRRPTRHPDAPPVLLIPGLMAGDASLVVLRAWLRRRGHPVSSHCGMAVNTEVCRVLERVLATLKEDRWTG
jgi:hypothetical protein